MYEEREFVAPVDNFIIWVANGSLGNILPTGRLLLKKVCLCIKVCKVFVFGTKPRPLTDFQ